MTLPPTPTTTQAEIDQLKELAERTLVLDESWFRSPFGDPVYAETLKFYLLSGEFVRRWLPYGLGHLLQRNYELTAEVNRLRSVLRNLK